MTLRELAEHYKEKELGEGCGKTALTREVYTYHLNAYILPRWGDERIGDIKAFRVEAWLGTLEKSNATKAKVKCIFGVLYQHAMRYGWAERNPIREVRQSQRRKREPDILTSEELEALIRDLPEPARTLVIMASTGTATGELIGLEGAAMLTLHKRKINTLFARYGISIEAAAAWRQLPLGVHPAHANARRCADCMEEANQLFQAFGLGICQSVRVGRPTLLAGHDHAAAHQPRSVTGRDHEADRLAHLQADHRNALAV